MATIAMQPIRFAYSNGLKDIMDRAPLGAGEVPNKGDVVYKSSGNVTECGADPANITGVMAHEYNEIHQGTFSGNADLLQYSGESDMYYYKAHDEIVFEGSLSGKASEATDVGTAYGIVKDGNGVWSIDGLDTSATRVRIIQLLIDDIHGNIGDTNHRVLFNFISNYQA